MMSNYQFDAERFCTNNFGRGLMLPNGSDCFHMIAQEIRALKKERAAIMDAARALIAIHRRHKDLTVYSDQDYRDIWRERVDALAALVGEG
jgi:hypothetical protein